MTIITNISQNMRDLLTTEAEKCAHHTQLIQRQGKVTGANLSQTLILGWWQDPNASLEQLCQTGMCVGLSITPQGLDQRLTKRTSEFLKALLVRVVAQKVVGEQVAIPVFNRFSRVFIQDSSIITLPPQLQEVWQGNGGKGTDSTVKIETRLELKHGQLDGPHMVDGRVPDSRAAQRHEPTQIKALYLRDLGYWRLDSLQEEAFIGAYWVSRLKSSTKFRTDDGYWSAAQWCRQQKSDRFEVPIKLGSKHQISGRLLGQRVPPDVAQERRRKLKRAMQKQGKTASAERIALCEWTLLVTNAPPELISYEDAFVLQRIRWQIELLFNLWKSHGHIDKSNSHKAWRQLCEFYAKLIAMVLQHWVFLGTIWSFPDRSWVKASQTVRQHVIRLITTINLPAEFERVLIDLRMILSRGCRINKSQKQKRAYASLLACTDAIS